jgi:hypothetical protein
MAVADVLLATETALMLAPFPPETVNSVEGVSLDQIVFTPVSVIVCEPLVWPVEADSESVGVPIVVVAVTLPVTPSVSVSVPVAPLGGVADVGGVKTMV